jgi:hypothetical protein
MKVLYQNAADWTGIAWFGKEATESPSPNPVTKSRNDPAPKNFLQRQRSPLFQILENRSKNDRSINHFNQI